MKIYLLRHAKRGMGENQDTLLEEGVIQSKKIVPKLANLEVEKIYCAETRRAKETISPFLEIYEGEVEYTSSLDEMRLGVFQGKTAQELRDAIKKSGLNSKDFRPEGGENLEDFKKRIKGFLENLKKESFKTILLSTHAGVIREIMTQMTNLPKEEIPTVDFASLSMIEVNDSFKPVNYFINKNLIENSI